MRCPQCQTKLDLSGTALPRKTCPHCGFYFYLRDALTLLWSASIFVDSHEDECFSRIHRDIYYPFIHAFKDCDPYESASILVHRLTDRLKATISHYPGNDLLFLMVALREWATWKVFSKDPWDSVHQLHITHVATNLVPMLTDNRETGDGIGNVDDLITFLILCEEIDKIVDNTLVSSVLHRDVTIEQLILPPIVE